MEYNNDIYLSPQYTKAAYRSLNLNINSDKAIWEKAVKIVSDRINGRFLAQINQLSHDINTNGFAIMALNCLLVETLLQFEIGKNATPDFNRVQYSQFLINSFPDVFDSDVTTRFYLDIRCGILHSAQTKGTSKLTCDDSYVVKFDGKGVTVSVKQFSNLLCNYFEKYKRKLLDENQTILRTNFIKKMQYICR